jgi:Mlc titration factor MtfA (ptsG expression regulator)
VDVLFVIILLPGATHEAEFFAVVSEYFFERPKLLKEKHPAVYEIPEKIFCKQPAGEAGPSYIDLTV